MKPRRRTGLAAVFDNAVKAGTMASSSGNATVTPIPRRKDQLFSYRADALAGLAQNPFPQTGRPVEFRPIGQVGRRVDRLVAFTGPPLSSRIEILEREAERVHARVAAGADRVGAMLFH